jgi:hypothetical protein
MNKIMSLLLCMLLCIGVSAQTVEFFPKSATQTFGLAVLKPDSYTPSKKYMLWIVGHGIGECGDGSQSALNKAYGWGGWGHIKTAVNTYDFIQVYLNTASTSHYRLKEYQYAIEWAKAKYSIDPNNICVLGHSLGSYGAGNSAFPDSNFAKQINIWFCSASGPFGPDITFTNVAKYGVKVWGVTATNDSAVGTNPRYVRQLYSRLKAINPNHPVMVSEFPSTTWPTPIGAKGSTVAHNAVLGRLTQHPSIGVTPAITSGLPPVKLGTLTLMRMNVYQWAKSNPKGSIYQHPTSAFVGPKYAVVDTLVTLPRDTVVAAPTTKPTVRGVLVTHDNNNRYSIITTIHWSDGTYTTYKADSASGRNAGTWINTEHKTVTLDWINKPDQWIKNK